MYLIEDNNTSHIGDDSDLLEIMVSHEQTINNLVVDMIIMEHRSIVEKNNVLYEEATEKFVAKIQEQMKTYWSKVISFFNNLWRRITLLFMDREKWVSANKAKIQSFNSEKTIMVNLPKNFKSWDTLVEAKKIDGAKINTIPDLAMKTIRSMIGGSSAIRKLINKQLTGKSEDNVNYSQYYNEKIGEVVETKIDNDIVRAALRQVEMNKTSKILMNHIKDIERKILIRYANKVLPKSSILKVLNIASSMTISCVKALHNTAIKVGNYSWIVCKKAATA